MSQHEEYTSPPGFRVSGAGGTKLAPVLIDPAAPAGEGDVITRVGAGYAPAAPSGGPSWLMSGEGSPVDTVTPVQQGAVYQDLTNGCIYLAVGLTSVDWLGLGNAPGNTGEAGGLLFSQEALRAFLLAGSRDEASAVLYLGSTWEQWNGHGCGLILSFGSSEEAPSQSIQVKTGTTGQFDGTLQDASGNMSMPGTITAAKGFIPPTSDPHIAGAVWNNAGTLTISVG